MLCRRARQCISFAIVHAGIYKLLNSLLDMLTWQGLVLRGSHIYSKTRLDHTLF